MCNCILKCVGLKKVTSDMQTHKNPQLRQGPAPFKAPSASGVGGTPAAPVDKAPVFNRDGKKWIIVSDHCIIVNILA